MDEDEKKIADNQDEEEKLLLLPLFLTLLLEIVYLQSFLEHL